MDTREVTLGGAVVALPMDAKSVEIEVEVFDVDGRSKAGKKLVAYWHRNPLKRWAVNLFLWFRDATGRRGF